MVTVGGSLLENEYRVHVLEVPAGMEDIDGSSLSMALVVLRRQSGLLLAVPIGVFSEESLAAGAAAEPGDQIGLSHQASVQAGAKIDLADEAQPVLSVGVLVDVLLVDVSEEIGRLLFPYDAQSHPVDILHAFNAGAPNLVPMATELAQAVWDWIHDPGSGELVNFSSAEEGDAVPETPRAPLPPGRRTQVPGGGGGAAEGERLPGQKKPRHTVASLAASLDQVTSTLPAVLDQLERLANRQDAIEGHLQGNVSRPSALKKALGASALGGLSAPSVTAAEMVKEIPMPRSSAPEASLPSAQRSFAMQEALQLQEEKGLDTEANELARAVLVQSQALSSLVQQLASGDPLHDLSSTASSLSTKGAQGRAKLQQELASHRGTFFNAVIQSMARRMQPARPADLTPAELGARGVTPTAYMERFGGYGRSRDLGCLQWQVAMILDHLQNDNVMAGKDGAALLAVCLEQAALDSGRLDIGLLLSLSEDPPAGVFQNRAVTTYAKGRAFAPLADQRWITVALAFIKEMDLIATKRQDALGGKADKPANPTAASPSTTKPKAKAKGGGRGRAAAQSKEEDE